MSGIKDHQVRVVAVIVAAVASVIACTERVRSHVGPIVTIAEVKSSFGGQHSAQVRFRGVVTAVNPNFGFFFVQDETAGTRVEPSRTVTGALTGHRVEITGNTPIGVGADTISDALVRDLGPAKVPEPVLIGVRELSANSFDSKRVTLVGTARAGRKDSSGQLVILLSVGGFEVFVRLFDDRNVSTEQLPDAEIRVTGVASTSVDIDGRLTDLTIVVTDPGAVAIQRAAPDPRSLRDCHKINRTSQGWNVLNWH
jgi:hypothetical protein